MRLDELLVHYGYASTRQRAKRLIKMGFVTVNGKTITKPSADVDFSARIDVREKDRPAGYWKLKMLDEKFQLIREEDRVIDIGSSSGGFLLYAGEKAKDVTGIEFSKEFEDELRRMERERPNIKVIIGDAFTIPLEMIGKADVLLIDVTTEYEGSLKLLRRYDKILSKNGRVLLVLKDINREKVDEFDFSGFRIIGVEEGEGREVYVVLEKL